MIGPGLARSDGSYLEDLKPSEVDMVATCGRRGMWETRWQIAQFLDLFSQHTCMRVFLLLDDELDGPLAHAGTNQ